MAVNSYLVLTKNPPPSRTQHQIVHSLLSYPSFAAAIEALPLLHAECRPLPQPDPTPSPNPNKELPIMPVQCYLIITSEPLPASCSDLIIREIATHPDISDALERLPAIREAALPHVDQPPPPPPQDPPGPLFLPALNAYLGNLWLTEYERDESQGALNTISLIMMAGQSRDPNHHKNLPN